MYYACPLSQTVQYCKKLWDIVEVISVLTLYMTAVTVKRSSGILNMVQKTCLEISTYEPTPQEDSGHHLAMLRTLGMKFKLNTSH